MNQSTKIYMQFNLVIPTLICSAIVCFLVNGEVKAQNHTSPPIFIDNVKILDSLKAIFKCDTIEVNNRNEKYPIKNYIIVTIINSKNLPPYLDDKSTTNILIKNTAKSIINKLKNVNEYQVIEIGFISRTMEKDKEEKLMHLNSQLTISNL